MSWGVRTIWETYIGWFQLRDTSELYPLRAHEALADLVELIGADTVCAQAQTRLGQGQPLIALHLAETVLFREPTHRGAALVMVAVHEALLANGGDVSFWESGWLRHRRDQWAQVAGFDGDR